MEIWKYGKMEIWKNGNIEILKKRTACITADSPLQHE